MKYEQLVKALTCGNDGKLPCHNNECPYWVDQWHGIGLCNVIKKDDEAAAAIEELDAEETRLLLITSELQDKVVELEEELNDVDIAADDNARQVEELQAEVKRLKECNDELREAQTYIDHYGDKWMTSAKDVPTSAYNHGYMDGKNEAEQALEPKRGEWVEDTTTYAGPGLSNYKCSLCGKICGTWRRGLEPSKLPNWCGNCGADMRKMEVQE